MSGCFLYFFKNIISDPDKIIFAGLIYIGVHTHSARFAYGSQKHAARFLSAVGNLAGVGTPDPPRSAETSLSDILTGFMKEGEVLWLY